MAIHIENQHHINPQINLAYITKDNYREALDIRFEGLIFKLESFVVNRLLTKEKSAHFTATVISEDQTHYYTQDCSPGKNVHHIMEYPAVNGSLDTSI